MTVTVERWRGGWRATSHYRGASVVLWHRDRYVAVGRAITWHGYAGRVRMRQGRP